MKRLSRLTAMLLALLFVFASLSPALAEEPPAEQNVTFKDLVLQQALMDGYYTVEGVKHSIAFTGYDYNHDGGLSPSELSRLQELDLRGLPVSSLEGLECATSLRSVVIDGGTLDDLTPIAALPCLSSISITNTQVSQLPQFQYPEKLIALMLSRNQLTGIEALQPLSNLLTLQIDHQSIRDLSPLSGLSKLYTLDVSGNPLEGEEPLAAVGRLPELMNLSADDCGLTSLEFVSGLTKLYNLSVCGNGISSLSPLKKLSSFTTASIGPASLRVSGNPIGDLTVLAELKNVTTLAVNSLEISDLSVFLGMEQLSTLLCADNQIADLSPLTELKQLYQLNLNGNQIEELAPLAELPALSYLYLRDNSVSNPVTLLQCEKLQLADLSENLLDLSPDSQTVSILTRLKELKVSVYTANQKGDVVPPTVEVDSVKLSSALFANTVNATRGGQVSVNATLKNEGDKPLTGFQFGIKLPEGVTVVSGTASEEIDSLTPGEELHKVLTLEVSNTLPIEQETLLLTAAVVKGERRYATSALRLTVNYATLNAPQKVLAGEEFSVYGEATPGSTVTIENEAGEALAVAALTGRWYTAKIPGQATGQLTLRAKVVKGGGTGYSAPATVGFRPDFIVLREAKAYYHSMIAPNPLTGIPTFSVSTNTRLIGMPFLIYASFSAPEQIESVTFQFANVTAEGVLDPNGFYTAKLADWTGTGVQPVRATVVDKNGQSYQYTVGQVTILIDPSGVVRNQAGEALEGVQVLLEQKIGQDQWEKWDAEAYLQTNPVTTGADGAYGWDVPEGTYRLKLQKEGYHSLTVETYGPENQPITVLPVRTDVDVVMEADGTTPAPKQTLEEAERAVKLALEAVSTGDADSETLLAAARAALTNSEITVRWTTAFQRVEPTAAKEGSLTGVLTLTNAADGRTASLTINRVLPALGGGSGGGGGGNGSTTQPVPPPVAPSTPFRDIQGHWAESAILEAVQTGLFQGVDETHFDPEGTMTRGMFVTVLGRLAKSEGSAATGFQDVLETDYYAPYVSWAAARKIVTGVGENRFEPERAVTREELAVMLYHYLIDQNQIQPGVLPLSYQDAGLVSDWAQEAVSALTSAGILSGKQENRFDPKGNATRAEMAIVFQRIMKLS